LKNIRATCLGFRVSGCVFEEYKSCAPGFLFTVCRSIFRHHSGMIILYIYIYIYIYRAHQKSNNWLVFAIIAQNRVRNFVKSGLKWVAVARHGLKLWENDATSLNILFKYVLGLTNSFTK